MGEGEGQELVLRYRGAARRWVEALPLGNGRLGAMVFGGAGEERLQLNADTLWSGAPRDWDNPRARELLPEVRRLIAAGDYAAAERRCREMQGPYTEAYQPLGELRLSGAAGGEAEGHVRELDLRTALAVTRYRCGGATYVREAFVSAPDAVLVVRLSCDAPDELSWTAALGSPQRHRVAAAGAGGLALLGRAPRHVAPNYYPAAEPVVAEEAGRAGMAFAVRVAVAAEGGSVTAGPAGVRVEGATAATLLLAAATGFAGPGVDPAAGGRDPEGEAEARLAAAQARGYAALRARHVADHGALFGRVELELGWSAAALRPTDERIAGWAPGEDPQLAALLFQYGRYLLIAASRPGTQPANLQGIWSDAVQPPWSSNYTLNINTQMNYWPAEVTNLAECHGPLLDMIGELSVTGARTARANYGCGGWVAHHNSDLWRQSAPAGEYGHGDPVWACWPMGGAWLCAHLWEHYLFGGDAGFLRERAYPLMRGAAEFCLAWLSAGADGRLVTAPSTSPENRFATPGGVTAGVSAGATMDMAIIWELLTSCVEASRRLGVDASLRAELEAALGRLAAPRVGAAGQLQEWLEDWDLLAPEPEHRHVSHLYGLHPGRQITARGTPALFAAARRSLELRGDRGTGWSMAWKINFWARLGEGDRAFALLRRMLTLVDPDARGEGGGVYANLLGAHPPFQIDGNLGATAGIAELLLQSHAGAIELLPALPAAWPAGAARGLRARGGFELDLAWRGGALERATVRSARGGVCRLRAGAPLRVAAGGAVVAAAQEGDGAVSFEAAAGASYEVLPLAAGRVQ